jgi:outer membrane murein-binding lipoprotein Lpp
MKKIIIIAAVILSSGLTAFCVTRTNDKTEASKVKIEKTDFAAQSINAPKSDLATAD